MTAPRYTWPAGIEKQPRHGADSPGVRLAITLDPRGDSTAVEIKGRSPTRPGWQDTEVAEMLQMQSVIEFAAALSEERKAKRKR